jgi:hypothetical protein
MIEARSFVGDLGGGGSWVPIFDQVGTTPEVWLGALYPNPSLFLILERVVLQAP